MGQGVRHRARATGPAALFSDTKETGEKGTGPRHQGPRLGIRLADAARLSSRDSHLASAENAFPVEAGVPPSTAKTPETKPCKRHGLGEGSHAGAGQHPYGPRA